MARKLTILAMMTTFWFFLSPPQLQANFIGIVPGSNIATITFDDTLNGGGRYVTGGFAGSLPLAPAFLFQNVTDLITGDSAGTAVNFSFSPTSAFISVPLDSFTNEPALAVGPISQRLDFSVTFTTNAGGVPAPFFTFAGFEVAGNVIPNLPGLPASFAQFDAQVDFTSGALGLLDTRTLSFFDPLPGPFDVQLLSFGGFVDPVAFDALTISGFLLWSGDPFMLTTTAIGSLGINPPGAIPEPSSLALLGLGLIGLLGYGWRSVKKAA